MQASNCSSLSSFGQALRSGVKRRCIMTASIASGIGPVCGRRTKHRLMPRCVPAGLQQG